MRLLAFDLETTGLDPQRDQVLEIGAVAFDPEDQNGDNDAMFICIVDPGDGVHPQVAWRWYQQSVSLKPEPNPNQGELPFPGIDGDQTR